MTYKSLKKYKGQVFPALLPISEKQ